MLRRTGFCVIAAMSLALFAGAVLLPEWANMQRTNLQLEKDRLRVREARETVEALERMSRAIPNDEVLAQRLAAARLHLYPSNENVVRDSLAGPNSPEVLSPIRYPDPVMQDTWMMRAAKKFEVPQYRRSVLLLAGGMLIIAFVLFAPPENKKKGWQPWKLPKPPVTKKD